MPRDDNPFELQGVRIYPRGGGSDSSWEHRRGLAKKANGKVRVSASGWHHTKAASDLASEIEGKFDPELGGYPGSKRLLQLYREHIPAALAQAAAMMRQGKDSHGRDIPEEHRQFKMEGEEPVKATWSQKAGCSCGCSPAFIAHNVHGPYDVSMQLGLKGEQGGKPGEGFSVLQDFAKRTGMPVPPSKSKDSPPSRGPGEMQTLKPGEKAPPSKNPFFKKALLEATSILEKWMPSNNPQEDEEQPTWHRHDGEKSWHPSSREHKDPTLHEKVSAENRQSGGGRHMAEASARSRNPARPDFDWDEARKQSEAEHPDPFEGLAEQPRARDRMPERTDIMHEAPEPAPPEEKVPREDINPDRNRLRQLSALTQNPTKDKPAPGRAHQRPVW